MLRWNQVIVFAALLTLSIPFAALPPMATI